MKMLLSANIQSRKSYRNNEAASEANGQMLPLQMGYSNTFTLPEKNLIVTGKINRPESYPQQERFLPSSNLNCALSASSSVEIVELVSYILF